MRRPRSAAALGLFLAASAGCTGLSGRSVPPPPPVEATLFLTAELRGAIEPCGCSDNMRGGLSRLAQVVNAARAGGRPVFLIDSGHGLFPTASIPEPAVGQQERKAKALAEGLTLAGLAVRAPGAFDDARGAPFRLGLGLPEVAPATIQRLDVQGHRVAVVSAGSLATASALAGTARREGAAFVVALVPLAFEAALPGLAAAAGVDLVLASQPKDELAAEQSRLLGDGPRLAQVQSKGRSLLRLDLTLRGPGPVAWLQGTGERDKALAGLDERVELMRTQVNDPSLGAELKALKKAKLDELVARRTALAAESVAVPLVGNFATATFVPVEASLPKDPAVAEVERAYNRDVGELNLAWAREHGQDCAPASLEAPGYIGSALCGSCHPEALAVWKGTKHPLAYAALVKEGKQHHLDCIGCHVGGWQQPGGVCRVDRTEGREEVTCESCHGPGSKHLAIPTKETIRRADSSAACVGCHDHENSPGFDYALYLPRIRGPGHGLPKPDAGVPGPPPKPAVRRR